MKILKWIYNLYIPRFKKVIKWTRTHLNRMSSLGTNDKSILVKWCIDEFSSCKYLSFLLLIIISVRYLLFVTAFILLVYTCLFSSIVKTSQVCLVHLNPFLEPTSAKQQEGKVSCSRKQREPLMGLELTTDRYPDVLPTAPRLHQTVGLL